MFEVEKKVYLDGTSRKTVEMYVRTRLGNWSPEVKEVDRYYRASGFRERVQTRADYLARVRVRGNTTTLNLKKLSDQAGIIIEHETAVDSAAEAEAILQHLGAELACTITKHRRKTHVDDVDLLLDDIDELGSYLELSIEVDEREKADLAIRKIDKILHELNSTDVELRGYPDILLEQQGVIFDRTR